MARAAGAEVVGAASIIDRGSGVDVGVSSHALITLALPTYDPAACPLCAAGTPVVKPGSRPDRV